MSLSLKASSTSSPGRAVSAASSGGAGVAGGGQVDLFVVSLSRFWSLLEERTPHILSYLEDEVPLMDEGFFKYLHEAI